ncbi:MAG: hypothetical protein ACKODE_07345, partial [Acidimicrobiaceae bacterium]
MANKSFIWFLRASVGILPFIGAGIDNLVDNHSTNVQFAATLLAWVVWSACTFAVFFLHPITLTVTRVTTPVIAATLIIAVFDTTQTQEIISASIGVAILLLSFNADIGNAFVQASAYGDEKRFLLRPPVALVAPVVLATSILIATTIAAPLVLAAKNLWIGLFCAIASAVGIWFFARRIHQLSRRWFVFVPAG